MNKADETVYLGRLISLLGKHKQLSLGEIKNKTRAFLRKRHQTDSSVFNTLELFVSQGMLTRKVHKARVYYALGNAFEAANQPAIKPVDLIEAGVDTGNELVKRMIDQARSHVGLPTKSEYKPKAPPPSGVEGFK